MCPERTPLRNALRAAASAFKANAQSFALAGSYALWVYGAPEPDHDVDFVVPEPDTESAAKILGQNGFDIERTPEDWLFKAYFDGVLVERHGLAPLLAPAVNEYLARTPPTAWVADLNRCPDSEWLARVQIIPCRAALGGGLLLGFRPDRLAVLTADGVAIAADAVVGIHSGSLSAGVYAALLHPAIMREFDGKEGRDICA